MCFTLLDRQRANLVTQNTYPYTNEVGAIPFEWALFDAKHFDLSTFDAFQFVESLFEARNFSEPSLARSKLMHNCLTRYFWRVSI